MQLKAILCRTSIKKLRSAYYKKLLLTYYLNISVKGKVFRYLLPSVGPGADPGVQAVSPQVT